MTDVEAKETKELVLENLRDNLFRYMNRLSAIDIRLCQYYSMITDKKSDNANLFELLGARKFLRMLDSYPFNVEKVKMVLKAYEGKWERTGGSYGSEWKYVDGSGGLLFSGMKGRTHYQLTPLQVFELAAPFGFMKSKEEWRRVCREAVYFIPRKSSKTTLSAFFQVVFFLLEDTNAEIYCVANSQEQSKILFKMTYDLLHQLDPNEKRIRFTQTEITWKKGQKRESKIVALTAGGKAKDGLFAQLCCADEYGSAAFVKDRSDMSNLLQVVEGSMGPRLQPMTVITTTAGRVNEGPFELKLRGIQSELLKDMEIPLDGVAHQRDTDWQFSLICCPDQWERDDESLQNPSVWKKVNHHIGITVQPDFYESEWRRMKLDDEKKREQICKLFNVFQTSRFQQWLSGDDIRRLQHGHRIEDLKADDGWVCFVGMDFSRGDDLNAQSYLCYNVHTKRYFADMDAWVTEETLQTNSNASLYADLVSKGFLRVCPGSTIAEGLIVERLMEIADILPIYGIGYDSYDAKRFVNAIALWCYNQGQDPKNILRPVSQTLASYNSPTQEMTYMVKNDPPLIEFSGNPMWPWEFGNCMLEPDRMDNVKPVKSSKNAKVDNVQCLLSALILCDQADGSLDS